ncbi:hypothetical protein SDC9_208743 [bioreactor metagenome]|uniref:Uncharacterized protein n=1 Tax=bioreactor metagenome TaxID=1076179 RepID=A0A645JEB1_9ZZZZ
MYEVVVLSYNMLYKIMPQGNLFIVSNIIICTIIGAFIYVIMLIILRVEEIKGLLKNKKLK